MKQLFIGLICAFISISVNAGVILKRGSVVVTEQDVERYIETNIPEDQKAAILAKGGLVHRIVESLYMIRFLEQESIKNNTIDQGLASWTASLAAGRNRMSAQVKNYTRTTLEKVNWESAAKEYYQVEKNTFKQEKQVSASHILFKFENHSEEKALQLAKNAIESVNGGADFNELALEVSEDAGAKRNSGALGYFSRGRMVREFEEKAFNMSKVGELSDPVKTKFGYHVLRLDGVKEVGFKPFSEVKDQIINKLYQEKAKVVEQNYLVGIKSSSEIKINDELMRATIKKYEGDKFGSPGTQ